MIAHTRLGFAGDTVTPIRPQTPLGRPSPVSFVQLSPPSTDFQRLLPGPPLSRLQGVRSACQKPGEEHARVGGIHGEVHRPRLVVHEEDLLPAGAPVLRAEDPALRVGAEGVAERGHVDEVGVLGMDADAPDLPRVLEADALPGLSRVRRTCRPRRRGRRCRGCSSRPFPRRRRWDRRRRPRPRPPIPCRSARPSSAASWSPRPSSSRPRRRWPRSSRRAAAPGTPGTAVTRPPR